MCAQASIPSDVTDGVISTGDGVGARDRGDAVGASKSDDRGRGSVVKIHREGEGVSHQGTLLICGPSRVY